MHQSRHARTSSSSSSSRRSRSGSLAVASLAVAAIATGGLGAALLAPASAFAATATVGLGTAASYSVLAGQGVTNTGPTTLAADLGTSPSAAISGFPPGVVSGATHAADAAAGQAQADLTTAYDDAAGRPTTAAVPADLVGSTLTPGVYTAAGPLGLTGTVTLDAQGDPAAVFVIQAPSSLTTGSGSRVSLVNGAQACNVFWQVSSSATIGTGSGFAGTILALTSVSVGTGATVDGRALARNGAVTLDDDAFIASTCGTTTSPVGSGTTPVVTPTPAPSASPAPRPPRPRDPRPPRRRRRPRDPRRRRRPPRTSPAAPRRPAARLPVTCRPRTPASRARAATARASSSSSPSARRPSRPASSRSSRCAPDDDAADPPAPPDARAPRARASVRPGPPPTPAGQAPDPAPDAEEKRL
ncbi:ice-binding family protein [Clavibacter capsici]|uniref:ice-binding family protein n=1 Tax=Clavibacter capsici TaxID=1874630 RepID=UPI000A3F4F98|nr:ice-binding family protein [Clavibacter capsici]